MILAYIDSKGVPYTKIIVKFWLGLSGIKFQYDNGQVVEVKDIEQCFIYEGITVQQEGNGK